MFHFIVARLQNWQLQKKKGGHRVIVSGIAQRTPTESGWREERRKWTGLRYSVSSWQTSFFWPLTQERDYLLFQNDFSYIILYFINYFNTFKNRELSCLWPQDSFEMLSCLLFLCLISLPDVHIPSEHSRSHPPAKPSLVQYTVL